METPKVVPRRRKIPMIHRFDHWGASLATFNFPKRAPPSHSEAVAARRCQRREAEKGEKKNARKAQRNNGRRVRKGVGGQRQRHRTNSNGSTTRGGSRAIVPLPSSLARSLFLPSLIPPLPPPPLLPLFSAPVWALLCLSSTLRPLLCFVFARH